VRDVLLILTTSLDGFIADPDGGVDWLLAPSEDVPPDYLELMGTIDTLVMGRATYETSLALEGGLDIFAGKAVYVFSSRDDLTLTPGVTIVAERAEIFVERLKAQPGGAIWLFGGGQLATALSDAGLIDEYLIAVQPILLGDGIPLWRAPHRPVELRPTIARTWPDGIVELRYRRADRTLDRRHSPQT